jgi:hypothetical protein
MALYYSVSSASVFAVNPNGPDIIEYLVSIAPHFEAVVSGDEGEKYTSSADWGTREGWEDRKFSRSQKPWWRIELSKKNRIIGGVIFGIVLILVKRLYFK